MATTSESSATPCVRERWAAADPVPADSDGIHLARSVTAYVRHTGRHLLPEHMLVQLSAIRRLHAAGRPFLDAFLDCILDKHEGRFRNRTYLALPVLELLVEGDSALSADRMSTLLMSDVVHFEIQAADDPSEGPCRAGRPDPATLGTRLRHALRFVAKGLGRAETCDLPSRMTHMPRSRLADLAGHLPRPPATDAWRWFDATVQPVSTVHDEYFFIRVLQTHEMLFTAIAEDMTAAIAALRAGHPEEGVKRIDHAVGMFERAAVLFRIVATIRPEQFSSLRQYTQGASAIQSEQYKRFEILCGIPTLRRLHSPAFTSVPAIRAAAEDAGHDTVTKAYLDLRDGGGPGREELNRLDAALSRLESVHQRWKSAHRGLAVRILGEERGTGHTDGVPYLTECLGNRLFRNLGTSL
ncbi:tryptophan 2,3-dioxygenase family protein [Streptomyces sp. NPDC088762]|uniref:tryptophan 2,3-dioxygenase family protein n=1 Tax=Streptomyces sp. NPDC088762 TaxID=3365891 RepID=UPI003805F717